MATIQGVDSSYDSLTVMEAQCLRRKGIRLFVQALTALPRSGLHQPAHRISNLRYAWEGGLATAGYLLIGPGMTGKQAVAEARRNIPIEVWNRLKFVAVDVEVQSIPVLEVLKALQEVERLGRTAIVYTSWNSWNTMILPRNSTLISSKGYGLWNASWDNDPDIDFHRLPFGGWKSEDVIGEQWAGGHLECGQSVDSNTFEEYVLKRPNKPEPAIGKLLIQDGSYTYAEVGVGATTHHWYIQRSEEVEAYQARGWKLVTRKPLGSRLDWQKGGDHGKTNIT